LAIFFGADFRGRYEITITCQTISLQPLMPFTVCDVTVIYNGLVCKQLTACIANSFLSAGLQSNRLNNLSSYKQSGIRTRPVRLHGSGSVGN
jgi:hypothetical protein